MKFRPEHLLTAHFPDGNYANAFILLHHIATAGHVAQNGMEVKLEATQEVGYFTYRFIPGKDLALSNEPVPARGFRQIIVPSIGDTIVVCGHHGPKRAYFETQAVVKGFTKEGRIIVERASGKQFQVGMSGSPGRNKKDSVVGVLVAGVPGTGGKQVYLEPASALQ